jgi:excinuclease ABC subunit B
MYADTQTRAMRAAIEETDRRRAIQVAYNEQHGITPASIVKGVTDIAEFLQGESNAPRASRRTRAQRAEVKEMADDGLKRLVVELEEEMHQAADELRFEEAARFRDEIRDLRRQLADRQASGAPA